MFKYFNYLVKAFLMKRYTYVFLLLSIVFYLIFSLFQVFSFNSNNLSYLKNASTFNHFPPFIMMVIYTCLFSLHCFNEPQEDGTELLFTSSYLGRKKMIIVKLLTLVFFVVFFQLINFIFYWIIALSDQQTNGFEKITYIFSLLVGGIIIQLIFCSVIAFLSLTLSRGAVLTTSILVAALLPILSFFLTLLGNGTNLEVKGINNPLFVTKVNVSSQKELEKAQDKFENQSQYFHYYDPYTSTIEQDYNSYKKNQWYDDFAFVDSWNQFNSLYNIFVEPNYYNDSLVQNWKKVEEIPKNDSNLSYQIYIGKINEEKQYATLLTQKNQLLINNSSNENYSFNKNIKKVAEKLNDIIKNKASFKNEFKQGNIIRRLLFIRYLTNHLEKANSNESIEYWKKHIKGEMAYDQIATMHKIEPISVLAYQYFLNEFKPNLKEDIGLITDLENNKQAIIGNIGIFNGENKVVNYYPSSFMPIYLIIILWISIASLFVGSTVAIYLRKDFS